MNPWGMVCASLVLARKGTAMHFVFYTKHEFGCPHVGHCPHWGDASLGTLVHAADEQAEWTDSLLRQIDALRAENTAKYQNLQDLTTQVEQLQRELKAESSDPSGQFCWKETDGPTQWGCN